MNKQNAAATGMVCNPTQLEFPTVKRRKLTSNFEGGNVTSDGGLLLVRQADRKLKLTKGLAALLPEERDSRRVEHS